MDTIFIWTEIQINYLKIQSLFWGRGGISLIIVYMVYCKMIKMMTSILYIGYDLGYVYRELIMTARMSIIYRIFKLQIRIITNLDVSYWQDQISNQGNSQLCGVIVVSQVIQAPGQCLYSRCSRQVWDMIVQGCSLTTYSTD